MACIAFLASDILTVVLTYNIGAPVLSSRPGWVRIAPAGLQVAALAILLMLGLRFLWQGMRPWWAAILPSLACMCLAVAVAANVLSAAFGPRLSATPTAIANVCFAACMVCLALGIPTVLVAVALDHDLLG